MTKATHIKYSLTTRNTLQNKLNQEFVLPAKVMDSLFFSHYEEMKTVQHTEAELEFAKYFYNS